MKLSAETNIMLNAEAIKKELSVPCDINILESTTSTIDYVKANRKNINSTPYVCLAEQQTAGKGRPGKIWHSPSGCNIYLSCLWNFNNDLSKLSGFSIVVGFAAYKALSNYAIDTKNLKIKWPNDIYFNQKKLAGILVDIVKATNNSTQVIISMGLNVNMISDNPEWSSMAEILNAKQDRNQIIALFLKELFDYLEKFNQHGFTPFLDEWPKHDYLFGKEISLMHGTKIITGIACGIDNQGNLLLRHPDGDIATYAAGEVTSHIA
ncbi:MAG: biotin--[acetyl-CoA-carboxylase] ligase [Gammaproteobacteria bacterium]|nr:biotin--[acetyl-CoA-carboxylase] ligase [Gammaproteobacteria bacterium]